MDKFELKTRREEYQDLITIQPEARDLAININFRGEYKRLSCLLDECNHILLRFTNSGDVIVKFGNDIAWSGSDELRFRSVEEFFERLQGFPRLCRQKATLEENLREAEREIESLRAENERVRKEKDDLLRLQRLYRKKIWFPISNRKQLAAVERKTAVSTTK